MLNIKQQQFMTYCNRLQKPQSASTQAQILGPHTLQGYNKYFQLDSKLLPVSEEQTQQQQSFFPLFKV